MATVDTLLVRIEADMSQLKKQLNGSQRAVEQSVGKQQKSFSALGRTIKGVVAGVVAIQAVRFGSHMVKMASHVEEMQAKSSVVFGKFTSDVRKELGSFGDAVGRSTFELEEMATTVQDTFVPMGFARGEASKLSVQLTKLAVDVASFNNASDVDTMRAFQSAIVGNHETVRRFGIVITEATLQQELHRMGIMKTAKEVSNAEKVQARLNLIMAGTTDAQGDAARTADSFANRMKALSAELNELGVAVFTPLLDDLADFIATLTEATKSVKDYLFEIGLLKQSLEDAEVRVKQLSIAEDKLTQLQKDLTKATADRTEALQNENQFTGHFIDGLDAKIKKLKEEIDITQNTISAIHKLDKARQNESANKDIDTNKVDNTVSLSVFPKERAKEVVSAFESITTATEKLKNQNILLAMAVSGATEQQIAHKQVELENLHINEETINSLKLQVTENQLLNKELEQKNKLEAMEITRKARLRELLDSMLTPSQELALLQNELNNAYLTGQISQEQYALGTDNLKKKLLEASDAGKMALDAVNSVADGFSREFADAMMTGELSLKSLKNVVADAMASIIRDFIRARIQAMLFKMVMGFAGGGTAPSTGPTTFDATTGGFAGGGTVQAKTPIMVGERGAEMFIPNTGGVVRNAQDTRMASGGKPVIVNQNINISTGVAQTVRAEVMNMMPQISQTTIQSIVDAKQRGGSFATIMS